MEVSGRKLTTQIDFTNMPPQTQNKFYKYSVNGEEYYTAQPDAGNTPYGHTPITAQEFITGGEAFRARHPIDGSNYVTDAHLALARGALPTDMGAGQSGYEIVNGVPQKAGTEAAKTQEKADIASGKLVQIGTSPTGQPLYSTPGSPAQLQTQATQQATQQGQTPEQAAAAGQAAARTTTDPALQPLAQANPLTPAVPTQAQGIAAEATPQPAGYMGNSVVDYLKSTGQPSDFASRSALASQLGITGYRGSSSQNIDMLNRLRSNPAGISTPTQSQTNGGANQASPNAGNPLPVDPPPETATVIGQHGFTPEIIQGQSNKSPFNAFVDAYKALYQDMGLTSVKQEYENLTKQYKELEDKKNDEIADINDDPWLTEGVRVSRIRKVESRYEGKTSNLTGQMKNMESIYDRGLEEAKFVAGQAMQASHNQDVLDQQWAMKAMELAQKDAEASEKHSPVYIEYQDAVDSGYKGTFSQYQTEDANRKIQIGKAGANGLTSYQGVQVFDSIVGKYNASPLIQAADRTPVLKDSINAIRKDPNNAALQLNLSYAYIQALDTYQSAVREGELSLVNSIDSKIGQLGNSVQQIQNGQIVRPDVALQIATAAEGIVNTINSAAKSKANSFQSQADVAGVGDKFKQFTGGFSPSYDQPITPQAPSFIPYSEISKYEGQNQSPYTPATVPPLQTNPKGFFDQFLSVFAN